MRLLCAHEWDLLTYCISAGEARGVRLLPRRPLRSGFVTRELLRHRLLCLGGVAALLRNVFTVQVLWQAVSEAVQVPDQVPDCEWEAGLVSVSVSTGVAPTGWCSGRP